MTLCFFFHRYFWGGSTSVLINILNGLSIEAPEIKLILAIPWGETDQIRDKINSRIEIASQPGELHKAFQKSSYLISIIEQRNLYMTFLVSLFYRKKVINWVHTDIPRMLGFFYTGLKRRVFDFLNNIIYKRVYMNLFVSDASMNSAREYYHLPSDKCHVIYNYLDEETVVSKAGEASDKSKYFCCVGRLTKEKRVGLIIDVFFRFQEQNPDVSLLILGDGPEEDGLKELTKTLGIESKVQFLGYCSNPYPYIKSADMLLSMSEYEAFPMVFLEAHCLDTPVFSTELKEGLTGRSEILNSPLKGHIVKSDDPVLLCQELLNYYQQINGSGCKIGLDQELKRKNVISQWVSMLG